MTLLVSGRQTVTPSSQASALRMVDETLGWLILRRVNSERRKFLCLARNAMVLTSNLCASYLVVSVVVFVLLFAELSFY